VAEIAASTMMVKMLSTATHRPCSKPSLPPFSRSSTIATSAVLRKSVMNDVVM